MNARWLDEPDARQHALEWLFDAWVGRCDAAEIADALAWLADADADVLEVIKGLDYDGELPEFSDGNRLPSDMADGGSATQAAPPRAVSSVTHDHRLPTVGRSLNTTRNRENQ